jgi:hypothetical protein
MGQGTQWIISNVTRFAALWLAALTVGALAIPGEASRFSTPQSITELVSLPLALCLMLFVAAFAAFVAFVFLTPVLALWLAVYLGVTFGLARLLRSDRSTRLAGIVAAPLLWVPFVHAGDALVADVSLAVICLYGLLVKPWPTNQSAPKRSATTA